MDFSSPLSEAEEEEGYSNGFESHDNAWPVLQKALPELASLDYPDIPRGRVVAIKRIDFVLYASRAFIRDNKKVEAVLRKFCLHRATATLIPDEHYEKSIRREELPKRRTDKDELEGLYDEFPDLGMP